MRCLSCNANLNDFESTRKYADTGLFVDLCNSCFRHVEEDIQVLEREDLAHDDDSSIEDLD